MTDKRSRRLRYFEAIKKAKDEHSKGFLSWVDTHSIWTAKRMAIGRDPDRFPSFPSASSPDKINASLLGHLFPPKPPTPSPSFLRVDPCAPPLTEEEIIQALRRSSNTSAPGLDQIPYAIWKTVNAINPSLLLSLLAPLLSLGYHPSPLKRGNGIVLPTPSKSDYSSPSSFRIIFLLETISKILQRIVTTHLSALARVTWLLSPDKCGSLAGLSMYHAASALT